MRKTGFLESSDREQNFREVSLLSWVAVFLARPPRFLSLFRTEPYRSASARAHTREQNGRKKEGAAGKKGKSNRGSFERQHLAIEGRRRAQESELESGLPLEERGAVAGNYYRRLTGKRGTRRTAPSG